MTTEDDFQRMLDANPDDHNTRLIFADWLQDRGDPRAEGYRALGVLRLCPHRASGSKVPWEWWRSENFYGHEYLSADMFDLVQADRDYSTTPFGRVVSKDFRSRRGAEDAAALAFAKLPADRQRELLAGPVACGGNG